MRVFDTVMRLCSKRREKAIPSILLKLPQHLPQLSRKLKDRKPSITGHILMGWVRRTISIFWIFSVASDEEDTDMAS